MPSNLSHNLERRDRSILHRCTETANSKGSTPSRSCAMLRFVRGLRARALTETLISRGAIVAASGDAAGADDPGSAVRRHLSPAGRCAIAQLLHCQQSGQVSANAQNIKPSRAVALVVHRWNSAQGDQDLAESLVPWRPQTQHWRSLHGSRAPQLAQNQLSPETEAPAVNPLQAIPQVQRSPEAVKTPSAGETPKCLRSASV